MARPAHSTRKETSLQPNLVIYVMFLVINSLTFYTRADQALMMLVPTMFVMFNERLVNQAILVFTMVSVFCLLSTLNTDTLCVLAAHTFLYVSIYCCLTKPFVSVESVVGGVAVQVYMRCHARLNLTTTTGGFFD